VPRLSEHFHSREFDCHDGTPTPTHALPDLRHLCARYLEPLRSRYGRVTIVSGYRTRAYNARVGGAPQSWHIYLPQRYGAAADVVAATGRPSDWYRTLELLDPGGLGAYSSHVHVDNRHGRARW
jgi:uncharacterized protein YcbK (DUF882 family)